MENPIALLAANLPPYLRDPDHVVNRVRGSGVVPKSEVLLIRTIPVSGLHWKQTAPARQAHQRIGVAGCDATEKVETNSPGETSSPGHRATRAAS